MKLNDLINVLDARATVRIFESKSSKAKEFEVYRLFDCVENFMNTEIEEMYIGLENCLTILLKNYL